MPHSAWEYCVSHLQNELPAQQFNTWIRPLQVEPVGESLLRLVAPNRFVLDWVKDKYKDRIEQLLNDDDSRAKISLELTVARKAASFESQRSFARKGETVSGGTSESTPVHLARATQELPTPATDNTTSTSYNSTSSVISGNSGNNETDGMHGALGSANMGSVSRDSANNSGMQQEAFSNNGYNPAVQGGNQEQSKDANLNHPLSNGNNFNDIKTLAAAQLNTLEPSGPATPVIESSIQPSIPSVVETVPTSEPPRRVNKTDVEGGLEHKSNLNPNFIFENFVVGKSNQLGLAAATQVAENPGGAYNPLFIYGGVGLGKTHLMHAVGNALSQRKQGAKVVYLHSERFVADMVKALQLNAINDFKRYYRSVDALLIDDIQFFAGKERSQEEFFHTFNALLEGGQQIIVTCDRYPKEIDGLEERLKSRFGWGLTVAIEPPELETRVAILKKKADQGATPLPNDAAFFIAQRIRSNVRELEGALKRVIANANFTNREISVDLVREALKDLLALQDRLVSTDNIQRVVAEYYKIKVSDLHSKRRSRSVARPRQVAMYLAKDLTNHSLPEIGESFGGRDHTTVLHACRKIKELLESDADIKEDIKNLLRILTT